VTPAGPPRKSALAFFGAILVLHLLPATFGRSGSPWAAVIWTEIFAFLLPAAAAAAGSNLDPRRFLLLARQPPPRVLGLALLAGVAGFAAAGALASLSALLLPARWFQQFDLAPLFAGAAWARAAMLALTVLLAPLCEEVAFRGYLQSALRLRMSDGAAVALGALLFAALHLNPVAFPGLLLLGALFGWLAARTGSIWPPVIAHATNNAISSLLAAFGSASAPPRPADLGAILGALAVGAASLAAVAAAFRRLAPAPPPASEALAPLDPARPMAPFQLTALPPAYRMAIAAGAFAVGAMALAGALGR
jgi:uncharacterized protein